MVSVDLRSQGLTDPQEQLCHPPRRLSFPHMKENTEASLSSGTHCQTASQPEVLRD